MIAVNGFNNKASPRNVIDIIDIKRDIANTHKYRREVRKSRLTGLIIAFACIVIFFLLGYSIASLYMPMWTKVLLFALIALVGLLPGYIVAVMFR